MANEEQKDKLRALIQPLVESLGLEFWGMELSTEKERGVLRIYVDAEDGVTLGRCAEASRNISVLLDVEDMIPGRYSLEVSSPGLSRPFFEPGQMRDYIGRDMALSLLEPRDNRKNFKGVLLAVDGPEFSLGLEDRTLIFHWDEVKKIHLCHKFPGSTKQQGRKKAKHNS
ncbi:MAG: ribosome maturation factor RimP [Thermodesulfobacteriota bacterium]|nr:ribosome maturation factor RimP [Thermodesulfobacteriota bacterium]